MGLKSWLVKWLLGDTRSEMYQHVTQIEEYKDYYKGKQKKQLKVRVNSFDDNLTVNLCGLIVDKSVSALVGDPADGHGLTWDFPEGTDQAAVDWLDEQWDRIGMEMFLHENALIGAETGIPAVKMVPDGQGVIDLINIDPCILEVLVDPQNKKKKIGYDIHYNVKEDDRDVEYLEETRPNDNDNPTSWTVELYKKVSGQQKQLDKSTPWLYSFPPILDWQNLPCPDSVYGRSEIESALQIQDRYNFLVSNISKIIRLYAHPSRYGKNLTKQIIETIDTSPDALTYWQGDGEVIQLPPVGDLPGAMAFLQSLREQAFTLSREVDTVSIKDKVGQITNFALRVMYHDTLDKLGTKRMLYGAAYQELNRRMLALGGYVVEEPCIINWPDPLPVNEVEEITALEADLRMEIVSKQTVQEARGYDHEIEKERMEEEQQGKQDAGGLLLSNFFANGGIKNGNLGRGGGGVRQGEEGTI